MTNKELLDRDKKNIGAPVLSLLHTLKEKGLEGPVQTAQRNLYRIEGIITAMRLKGTICEESYYMLANEFESPLRQKLWRE